MKIIYCSLLIIVFACSYSIRHSKGKPVFTLKDFKKTILLNGKATRLPGIKFPVRATLIPDKNVFMCIEGETGAKKCINIYSLDSVKLLISVINHGETDGELLGPFNLQYSNHNGGEVYVLDAIKQQVYVYKIDSLIAGHEKPFVILGRPFNTNQRRYITDDRMMRTVITDKSYNSVDLKISSLNHKRMLFNKYRSDFSVRDSFGFYPQTTEDIPPTVLGQVVDGCINISADNRNLVFNGLTTDYLTVYDTSGQMIAATIGPGELGVSYRIEKAGNGQRIIPSPGHEGYAGRAQMNKESLFVLYDGRDIKTGRGFHVSNLFKFTPRLHPEIRYILSLPVYDFDIDWRTRKVYALRNEGETAELVIYQL